jgi:hypothetical protein
METCPGVRSSSILAAQAHQLGLGVACALVLGGDQAQESSQIDPPCCFDHLCISPTLAGTFPPVRQWASFKNGQGLAEWLKC